MSQATELIAAQMAAAANIKNIWGNIIINVKAVPFNAKGDWNIVTSTGTDDTAAIQAAINYANSIGKKEVTFPSGTYKYGVLTNTSGITPIGDGVSFVGTTPLTLTSIADQKTRINNLIVAGNSGPESADARVSTAKGKTFAVLKDRLEESEVQFIISESSRIAGENGRVSAEAGRVSAEAGRVTRENVKVDAEAAARIAADNAESTTRATADTAETNARIGADTAHATSLAAHSAANIGFASSGMGSSNAQAGIKEAWDRAGAIIASSGTSSAEVVDMRTLETGYTPSRTITLAGDVSRDTQSRLMKQGMFPQNYTVNLAGTVGNLIATRDLIIGGNITAG